MLSFRDKKSYVISFVTALAVANISGPQYIYPTYGTSLANKFHWNGIENSMVSTATFVGVSFSGPLVAWMVETLGIKNTLRIASFSASMGLFLLAQTYAGYLSSHYLICSFYLMVTGAAGAASYICSLDSQAHNFKSHRGMSMGLASASLGMSGLVFAQINDQFFKSRESTFEYLLFIGTCTALIAFFGSFILGPLNSSEVIDVSSDLSPEQQRQQQDDIISQNLKNHNYYSQSISSFSTSSTQIGEEEEEENDESRPLLSKKLIVSADNIVKQQVVEEVEEPEISGIAFFSDPVGFALSIALLVILGLGYVYLANIGQLLHALSSPTTSASEAQHLRNLHVSIFSLANCASRAGFGTLSDILQKKLGLHRLWFFWFAALGLVIGMTQLLFISTATQLIPCTVMIAIVYGITFGIAPATISEFGTKAFARNWGLLLCAPAIGSQLFNVLFGTVYQHHTDQFGLCFGNECYQLTFIIGIGSAFVCIFVLSLAIYKKGLYKSTLAV